MSPRLATAAHGLDPTAMRATTVGRAAGLAEATREVPSRTSTTALTSEYRRMQTNLLAEQRTTYDAQRLGTAGQPRFHFPAQFATAVPSRGAHGGRRRAKQRSEGVREVAMAREAELVRERGQIAAVVV